MTILDQDLNFICSAGYIPWDKLCGRRILVTGATGLIGGLVTRALLFANNTRELGLRVVALVRNRERVRERVAALPAEVESVIGDVANYIDVAGDIDYIIHAASETSSRKFVEHPVETIKTIVSGTEKILELARAKRSSSVLYLSSMEVYGDVDATKDVVKEADLGYVDPLIIRNCYPEGKRLAESLCKAFASEYNVPVKIARLVQTFGPGISPTEDRVFAQFARSVMKVEPIVLKTSGSKAHCYCYTADAITGLFTILLKGEQGEAYNVSNEATFMSIREMAEMLSKDVKVELDDSGIYPKSTRMKIGSDKLRALGWRPLYDLKDMYNRLMEWMGNAKV